jgi:nucleotide sugar dehydrogenase
VKASKMIRRQMRRGQLIILESTSYPTTTREVVLPNLVKSKLTPEEDFFLCFSPERVNPGSKKFPLTKIPKVIGGLSPQGGRLAKCLYSKIIKKIFLASSPEIAETSKLLENTYRLVNIALANEFAIVCSKLGISVWEVIDAASTKPFGFMPFYPGPGTGGHCIPCDPLYLSWKAKKLGFSTKMIDLASYVNHCMPHYVVQRVSALIKRQGGTLGKARVLILGVTYKKDVKDLRESPALDLIEELTRRGARVDYFDPLIPYLKVTGIDLRRTSLTKKTLPRYRCVIVATDHSSLDYSFLQRHARLIFDTRRVYQKKYDNVRML